MRIPRNSPRVGTVGYLSLATVDSCLAGRRSKAARQARYVTKPLLMPVLAAGRQPADDGGRRGLTRGVHTAQLFSWGGDVALLGGSRTSFLVGVASFLAAHLSYIRGFRSVRDDDAGMSAPGVKVGTATWAVAAPIVAGAAGRRDPTLRAPVAVYSAVLSAMFATSTMLDRSMPTSARGRIVAGTSLFLLSDSLLAVQRFLRSEPSAALESAVMVTYTTGQWLIADGARSAARAV